MTIFPKALLVSLVVASSTTFADSQGPSVVNGVSAQSSSSSAISISWNAAQDNVGVRGYNIYRDGNYFDTIIGSATQYTDSRPKLGRTHNYAVVAFDAAKNYSRLSDATSASADDTRSNGTPIAPSGVSANRTSGSRAVITWNTPPGGANSYNIYKNGGYSATVHGANTYTDSSLNGNDGYDFQVVAIRDNKYSTISAPAYAASSSGGTPPTSNGGTPATPSGVQFSVLNNSSIKLSWNEPAGGAEGYNVNMNSSYLATVKGQTEFVIEGLNTSSLYRVSVAAFRADKYSVNSPDLTVSTASGGTAPPPESNIAGIPAGYSLVFNEEFNGWDFDTSKWNTRYRWGADWIINNEAQYYVDTINNRDFGMTPFKFSGDKLTIEASRTPDWLRDKAKGQNYLSGAISTHNKFNMKYGYVEMRAMLPKGKGLWPAFWLLHSADNKRKPEIDVMELLGDNSRMVYQTYHYYDNGQLRSTPSFEAPGPDYSTDFHTFGMLWEPGLIAWYVDGVETNRYTDAVPDEDMYLLLNLATGGFWAGNPDSSTPFPAKYQIDYVRAYQKR